MEFKGYGAILGDIIGSIYEMNPIKSRDFELFQESMHYTDDTLMTLATMSAINGDTTYNLQYLWWGNMYYGDYYGKKFKEWLKRTNRGTNISYGNGSAMRVSPIGYHFSTIEKVMYEATLSAITSHSHHEAIKGAMCIAGCIFYLNEGKDKEFIKNYVNDNFYDTSCILQPFEKFKVSCQDTVPIAVKVFLESNDMEDCIRTAISLGGDCDTIASMACELRVALDKDLDQKYVDVIFDKLDVVQIDTLLEFNDMSVDYKINSILK